MNKQRCLVAMSGGVDSSVTAALMQQAEYECVGVTMLLHKLPHSAEALTDAEEAARVCAQLGIPHVTLDLTSTFVKEVIDPFVSEYCEGRTPNPCIRCNKHLKFSALQAWAKEQGFDCVATGHYAQIEDGKLLKAKDQTKDQSYVLYALTPEQLAFVRFPLGGLTKQEVRALAKDLALDTAERAESQDICFVPDGNHPAFIEAELTRAAKTLPKPGDILDTKGAKLGTHAGIHHFTIGQRKGIGIAHSEPLYVLDIDAASATVLVGTREESGKNTAILADVNILAPDILVHSAAGTAPTVVTPSEKLFTVKHRYRGKEHPAKVFIEEGNTSKIVFLENQRDLTRGQALVFYDGDRVVGGGTIIVVGDS